MCLSNGMVHSNFYLKINLDAGFTVNSIECSSSVNCKVVVITFNCKLKVYLDLMLSKTLEILS